MNIKTKSLLSMTYLKQKLVIILLRVNIFGFITEQILES